MATNLRDFKKNKKLKMDLRYLIFELEGVRGKLHKYKIYKDILDISDIAKTAVIKYKNILEKIDEK